MPRKRRNDRNHLIYKLTCSVDDSIYIGMTFIDRGKRLASLDRRWRAHLRNAMVYGNSTILYDAIRTHGPETFTHEIIEVVRGKAACHAAERQFIKDLQPALNMEGMGRKCNSKKEEQCQLQN